MNNISTTRMRGCCYMEYMTSGYFCKFFHMPCDERCSKTYNLTIEEDNTDDSKQNILQ